MTQDIRGWTGMQTGILDITHDPSRLFAKLHHVDPEPMTSSTHPSQSSPLSRSVKAPSNHSSMNV